MPDAFIVYPVLRTCERRKRGRGRRSRGRRQRIMSDADYRLVHGGYRVKTGRRLSALLALTALLACATPMVHAATLGDTWSPRGATFGVAVQKDVMITM